MDGNKNKKGQWSKILVCSGQYLYHKNRDYLKEGGDLVTVGSVLIQKLKCVIINLMQLWRCRNFPGCKSSATTLSRGGDLHTGETRVSRTKDHPNHLANSGEVSEFT